MKEEISGNELKEIEIELDEEKLTKDFFEKDYTNCTIAVADIYKAYDQVNLDIVDGLMKKYCDDVEILNQWKNEYDDLMNVNMSVSGVLIKRTIGILQGSELAPFIFNFLSKCILFEIDKTNVFSNKIIIYADNWIVIGNRKEVEAQMKWINMILENFGLKFSEVKYYDIGNIIYINNLDFSNHYDTEFKFLGMPFGLIKNELIMDLHKIIFPIKYRYSMSPNTAILHIKKYINPKFNYYYSQLKIWNIKLAKHYLWWYKDKLRKWIMKTAVIYKVPRKLLRHIVHKEDNNPMLNYYFYYAADMKELHHDNTEIKLKINRWRILSEWVVKNPESYLGIYTITNFINDVRLRTPEDYIKIGNGIEKTRKTRMFRNLDLVYNAIVANKDLMSFVQYNQETINYKDSFGRFDPFSNKIIK